MKSNDEEYLDSLLNSAQQSNNSNQESALSRMAAKRSTSDSPKGGDAEDISELVNNSNGNADLDDIGNMLGKLDRGEALDAGMEALLDSIEEPTDPSIPQFTVGAEPSMDDIRDPEEIALDEAIADAELMDAEMQAGKHDSSSFPEEAVGEEAPRLSPAPTALSRGAEALGPTCCSGRQC